MVDSAQVRIRRVSEGLGFGKGLISGRRDDLPPEIEARIDDAIEHSPDILVPVDRDDNGDMLDDDGCGDGRGVKSIFKAGQFLKRSLSRAKVFGGGLTMTAAARIGLGQARGRTLNEVFQDADAQLADNGIEYGAHTDTLASGQNCGCGAIDKAPEAIENVLEFENDIRSTIALLGVYDDGLDDVCTEYRSYAAENSGRPYSGLQVMDSIKKNGKVVKQLDDSHNETRLILNMVEGMTVNQQLIRDVSDNQAQVFVTDVWRLQQIARRLHKDDPAAAQRALLSELVYTLGVSATLTQGDLPTYVVDAVPIAVAA